jgi:broad specificity phosphatase PhoE
VSETVRLTLISHAMTDATAAARFPTDEPLNAIGRGEVTSIDFGTQRFTALCGPEQRCMQTAQLLGLDPVVEPRLADLDVGRWRGSPLAEVGPADLTLWLTDPASASHGGESVTALIGRVGYWLDSLTANPSRTVAVTHSAVVRAAIVIALDAPPKSFWRIDTSPATRTDLNFRGHAWTLRNLSKACG